jgi:uridine kinase
VDVKPVILRADDLPPFVRQIELRLVGQQRPLCVAVDGRSGAGKSTLAKRLAQSMNATLLDGDGFFAGGVAVRGDLPEHRARDCIDWRRQRAVLEALRAGRTASYRAFDWEAFDGSLRSESTVVEPRSVVIVEGVYSARPELADLIDLRVLLRVPDDVRRGRLLAREQSLTDWELQWHKAEDWYFAHAAPVAGFDVIVDG